VITSRAFDIKERSGPAVLHDVRHAVLNVLREDSSALWPRTAISEHCVYGKRITTSL
jgi:hypothetical protein